jgi:hypothetical protein
VPRGEPQRRHLIGVEEGAFSAHSKLMPKPSQTLQIISNLGRVTGICMAVLKAFLDTEFFEQSRQAKYDRLAALPVGPDDSDNCPVWPP